MHALPANDYPAYQEGARVGRARPAEEGEQGAEAAPPALAFPAQGRGPEEKDMSHAAPRMHRDADHWGDEEGARAGRARPAEEGEPAIDSIQTSAAEVHGTAGKGDGPRSPGAGLVWCRSNGGGAHGCSR